ncbi:MAG: DegV family protein [Actinomycetota bacterium]
MIAVTVDSNGQLPPELAAAWDVSVIPITIVIDGEELPETEVDADEFYDALARGAEISTSLPAPGEIAAIWDGLAARLDADEIVSFHVSSDLSGTCNSARLAAELTSVPVRVVDTGQVSFGISCALWAARLALAEGVGPDEALDRAAGVAKALSNVFVMDGLELARRSGRLSGPVPEASGGVDVYSFVEGHLDVVGAATGDTSAVELMADTVLADRRPIRAAVGHGHASLRPVADALAERLSSAEDVVELVRYRVGPSVAAFSGPGSAGAYWFPAD